MKTNKKARSSLIVAALTSLVLGSFSLTSCKNGEHTDSHPTSKKMMDGK